MNRIQIFVILFLLCSCSMNTSSPKETPQFAEKDFISGKPISSQSLKGKYTMIDFWGTWCVHCIDALPELVEIHQQYGDRLQILSIADDKPEDVKKLKQIITSEKLTWQHIWTDGSKPLEERLSGKFAVDVYPTMILLDPSGKEIDRLSGFLLMKRLRSKLASLSLQK